MNQSRERTFFERKLYFENVSCLLTPTLPTKHSA